MKITTKKIIAREFLLLIFAIFISCVCYLVLPIYNSFQVNKINDLNLKVNSSKKYIDSISLFYNKKYKNWAWLYNTINEKFDLENSIYNDPRKLWSRLNYLIKKDSFDIKFNGSGNLKESFKISGLNSLDKAKSFILQNNLNEKDIKHVKETLRLSEEVNKLKLEIERHNQNILYKGEKLEFTLWFFAIMLILIFPFRFLILGIRWSVKTLKT